MPQMMQAISFRRYGPPEVLERVQVERPGITPDAVLLRVAAAGVNPADTYLRGGRFHFLMRSRLPIVPGADIAGVVESVGSAVTLVRPGDAVYAMLPPLPGGAYAEYAVVAERHVARAPHCISLAQAAAVPLAGLTALQALRDKAKLEPGQRLLINGASGGVGSFAVQIAKAMGARVTAACSGRNADLVGRLGADEVMDYTQEDVTAAGAGYDVIFDAANAHAFRQWRRTLRPGGVLVTVNPAPWNYALGRLARLTGGSVSSRSSFVRVAPTWRCSVNGSRKG